MRGDDDRGQSEVLGSLLLVAVVVVLGTVLTVAAFAFLEGGEAADPVSLTGSADAENVTITHQAGREIEITESTVILRQGSIERRIELSDFQRVSGSTDGTLVAGDVRRHTHDLDPGPVEVLFVDEKRNQVLYEGTLTIPDPGIDVVQFDEATIESFESNQDQDGSSTVLDRGTTLKLTNNTWKRVDYDYEINASTVLTFEFKSTGEGEIHGLGLENDNRQTSGRIFHVFGTQNWGERDFDTYQLGDGWVRYEIPVGDYYTGPASYLVLVNDDDSDASGNSFFRNVRVYEEE
jgi:flagellin-like protein